MSFTSWMMKTLMKMGDDKRDEGLTTPDDVQRFDDIYYGPNKKWQKLDVYRPKDREGEKLPVLVSIHGGGWVYGDKERYQYYCMHMAEKGFAVVNFTYRLAPDFKWPASFEDTNLVFTFVMDNAEKYGFDLGNIFAVGDSAGGHMITLYAGFLTNPDYAAKYEFKAPEGLKLNAIISNCGAYIVKGEKTMRDLLKNYKDDAENDLVSPLLYITENYPPTLLVTAPKDFLKDQQPKMKEELEKHGVETELQYYDQDPNLAHVFMYNMKSDIAEQCNEAAAEWLRKHIK